jgi:DNA invertase Pin-like site-specific DNA recombinase
MDGTERRRGRPRVRVDIGRALELRRSGLGYKRVAQTMGLPRTTVYRALKRAEEVLGLSPLE